MDGEKSGLTENQRRFVAEYVVDRNATRAYLRAFGDDVGYGSARTLSSRLLADINIRAEIEAAGWEHARRCGISARRVLRELASVAFADVGDAFEDNPFTGLPSPRALKDMPPATRRAIQSVKVKRKRLVGGGGKDDTTEWEVEEIEYKFADKLSALDKLCKHLGLTDGTALERIADVLSRR